MPAVLWRDGVLLEDDAPDSSSRDRGLLLGDGLFETLLAVDGRPVLLAEHLNRLMGSAAQLGFELPGGLDLIEDAVAAALEGLGGRAAIRITLTRGAGPRGIAPPLEQHPVLRVSANAADAAAPTAHAATLDAPRLDPLDPVGPHKTTSALRWVEARRRARARGADLALVRTIHGDVAEADFANLFAEIGGAVITPPLSRGILPGVTRAWAMETLQRGGRLVLERPVEREDLDGATEVFLTSSLIGARALETIDGTPLPAAHPTTDGLVKAYERLAAGG